MSESGLAEGMQSAAATSWRSRGARLIGFAGWTLLAVTALAATAERWWVGELAVNFRLQLAVSGVALAAVLAWQRRLRLAAAVLAAALLSVSALAPLLERPAAPPAGVAGAPTIRIATGNVLFLNHDYDRLIEWLGSEQPDVVVLVETTPEWRAALAALRARYPVQYVARHGERRADVLLLTRLPVVDLETLEMTPRSAPAVLATLEVRGRPVRILGVHVTWPLGPEVSQRRAQDLQWIARLAQQTAGPLVVAGDLNLSPFSPGFARLLHAGGLASAAAGRGWQPTWPTFLPLAGIQIDHVLLQPGHFEVLDFRRGPRNGSDHWPIVADLALTGR